MWFLMPLLHWRPTLPTSFNLSQCVFECWSMLGCPKWWDVYNWCSSLCWHSFEHVDFICRDRCQLFFFMMKISWWNWF
jgi:hypothetical protein